MGYYINYYMDYFLYLLPALIVTIVAQVMVSRTYSKYSKVRSGRGYTGAMAARAILDSNGLQNGGIEHISGNLTDHYDPRTNVVRLSDSVYNSDSVAAIGVAAHEVGHAVQQNRGYLPMKIRAAIIPATQIGSKIAIPLFFIGLILSFEYLTTIGIILFSATVLFQLVTLPVEFNASRRALQTIEQDHFLEGGEVTGAKKVLSAAAMTYVAGLLMAIMQLLRLLAIAGRRND